METRLLTVNEAADYLDVHPTTVRRWIELRLIAHELVGPFKRVRVPEAAVKALRQHVAESHA